MSKFATNDRVFVPGSAEHGTVEEVQPLAEGLWAEQFYSIRLDDNELCCVTLHEIALVPESEAPSPS